MKRDKEECRNAIRGFAAVLIFAVAACKPDIKTESEFRKPDESQWPDKFEIGRSATENEIALLDIDVRPDGKGLPEGSGDVKTGMIIYQAKCEVCHGTPLKAGPYGRLFPIKEEGGSRGQDKVIGSYWPYATTLFDYINRAMPFTEPGSLTPDEVYSLTAFLLNQNKLVADDAIMNPGSLPQVHMPARELFVVDDRKGGAEIR